MCQPGMSTTPCGEDLHFLGGRGQKEKNVAIGNVAWQDVRGTQPRRDAIIGVFRNFSLQFALHFCLGPGLSLKGGVHNQYIPKNFWNINVSCYRVFFVVFTLFFVLFFWCFVLFYGFFLWNVLCYSICFLILCVVLCPRLAFAFHYHHTVPRSMNQWVMLHPEFFGKFGLAVKMLKTQLPLEQFINQFFFANIHQKVFWRTAVNRCKS